MVYDKSDKHATVYDSYNKEDASTSIESVSTENITKTYSIASKLNSMLTRPKNNSLCGTVRAVLSLYSRITQTTRYIKSCLKKANILPAQTNESVFEIAKTTPVI